MGSHLLEGVTPWGAAGGRTVFNVERQVPKLKERSVLPIPVNLLPSLLVPSPSPRLLFITDALFNILLHVQKIIPKVARTRRRRKTKRLHRLHLRTPKPGHPRTPTPVIGKDQRVARRCSQRPPQGWGWWLRGGRAGGGHQKRAPGMFTGKIHQTL